MRATAGSPLSRLTFVDPHLADEYRHVRVPSGGDVDLPSVPRSLDADIVGAGRRFDVEEWRRATFSTSLLVVDRGTVTYEWYADGFGRHNLFLGASMTKSALAHLMGLAVTARRLNLDATAVSYVPELAGSGYDSVRIRDLITMTTGLDWDEDYRDPSSPASRLIESFSDPGGDSRSLLCTIGSRHRPGERFAYCTADSQVLDWVRERTTGLTYADHLATLWRDLGCVDDAVVGVDAAGVALAGGGLAATARDWARIGMLAIDGRGSTGRLLDAEWTETAVRPAYPYLAPGRLPSSITTHAGFGYHWWPADSNGRYVAADGSRGQFAYVDRAEGVVVVKTSLWPYDEWLADRQCRDLSYLGLAEIADAAIRARIQ